METVEMKYSLSELTAIIKDRRTVYPESFTTRKVQREMVETILNNAIWAPTHGRTEPWRFKVFFENGLQTLSDTIGELYQKLTPPENYKEHTKNKLQSRPLMSSVVILVGMKRGDNVNIPAEEEQAAVACAIQNMALTCTAYGLGFFWSTPKMLYQPEALKTFGMAEEDRIMGLFYIGYTDQPWPKSHRKPLEYVTEWINN